MIASSSPCLELTAMHMAIAGTPLQCVSCLICNIPWFFAHLVLWPELYQWLPSNWTQHHLHTVSLHTAIISFNFLPDLKTNLLIYGCHLTDVFRIKGDICMHTFSVNWPAPAKSFSSLSLRVAKPLCRAQPCVFGTYLVSSRSFSNLKTQSRRICFVEESFLNKSAKTGYLEIASEGRRWTRIWAASLWLSVWE